LSFTRFVLQTKVLISTRLDPIFVPKTIGGHVHNIVGGNRFNATFDPNNPEFLLSSTCTTSPITVDKSSYWAPALYFMDMTTSPTTFTRLQSSYNIWYIPNGTNPKAFPPGLQMVAGDATSIAFNTSSPENLAISWGCFDSNNEETITSGFPPTDCPSEFLIHFLIFYLLNSVSDRRPRWTGVLAFVLGRA
jgi:hypothetical protein